VPQIAPQQEYTRKDVRRQFGLTERQLRSWERQGLLPHAESYLFSDLAAIRTLSELHQHRFRAREIGRALQSLRLKTGNERPLSEMRLQWDGKRITVRMAGQMMEAVSGQILLDFDSAQPGGVTGFPDKQRASNRLRESESWFQKGLELEETGAPVEQVIEVYQKVIELNADAPGALVNLGTIYYRLKRFPEAEDCYQKAIVADPDYSLPEFNLGNLYDELNNAELAERHYKRAIEIDPRYADAHFNLALLYERSARDGLKAMRHWKAYLRLDPAGEWARVAQRQLDRLRKSAVIQSTRRS
jgi:tetratricopeptide (TPR) repeat protein